jgi:hypothetical protein
MNRVANLPLSAGDSLVSENERLLFGVAPQSEATSPAWSGFVMAQMSLH